MLSKEQILKIDPELSTLSDSEIIELRDTVYAMAQVAFDAWYYDKFGSKNHVRSLTTNQATAKI